MKIYKIALLTLVLAASSVILSTHVKAQSAISCTNNILEGFNGAKINDEIWTYKTDGNSVNGILSEWAKKDGNTSGASYLRAKNLYSGDFESSVDILSFEAINSSANDGAAVRIQAFKQSGESVDAFAMTWRKRVEGSTLAGHIHRNKVFEETSFKEVDAGKPITIKVTRTGSTAEFYYKNLGDLDSEYILVAKAENVTTEAVTIGVSVIITSGNTSGISATFDNFYIGCIKSIKQIEPSIQTVEVPVEKTVTEYVQTTPTNIIIAGVAGMVVCLVLGFLAGMGVFNRRNKNYSETTASPVVPLVQTTMPISSANVTTTQPPQIV